MPARVCPDSTLIPRWPAVLADDVSRILEKQPVTCDLLCTAIQRLWGTPLMTSQPTRQPPGAPSPADQQMLAVIGHLASLVFAILSVGIGGWVVPLALYLIYRNRSPFMRQHAAEALNFQISITVLAALGWLLTITFVLAIIGIPLLIVVGIGTLVFPILAALTANRGERYRYPMTLHLIR